MKKRSLKELNRIGIPEFKAQKKAPIVLVLDNIRSAHNVGAAFRTADAFAIEKIVLCGITAQPPHREILKTAIGASQSVEWEYKKENVAALKQLKAEEYKIIGVEQTDESTSLEQVEVSKMKKYALVFGNEVQGIDDQLLPLLDEGLEIPQFGTKHSLNVSVSMGIVLWTYFRAWKYGRIN
ncbi:MAG: RNA methyltransferase [Bacteroidota bacterium]